MSTPLLVNGPRGPHVAHSWTRRSGEGMTIRRLIAVSLGVLACSERSEEPGLRAAEVTRRDIVVAATAAGVIEPVTTVEVKSRASGEIIEVMVEEGDGVRAGRLLARVDPRIPTNAVMQAEADSVVARAQLDNAEAQLARAEALHRSQAITDLELETARLARATAYASLVRTRRTLEDAKIALEATEVRAAVNGVILARLVEVGSVIQSASSNVGGGAVLMRMASLDTVRVRALVDETDIGMIEPGMAVTIQVASFPNRPFRGEVERIGAESVVLQNVTMFPVLARIANLNGLLRPGMNAEVQVHIGELQNTLAVPNAALRTPEDAVAIARQLGLSADGLGGNSDELNSDSARGERRPGGQRGDGQVGQEAAGSGMRRASLFGGDYIAFVLKDGRPQPVRVLAGLTDFDFTAIRSGLEEGDSVLLLPTAGLLEDQQRRQQWARERAGSPLGQQR